MALLHRFVKLHDRGNTHVFSFVVTRSVTRDLHRDVTSKELTYGYQRWAITFSRTDKLLGVYLVWRNPCDGMRVYIDFTFTILNREHFSVNEAFTGKQVKFTFDSPAQGNRRLITMEDLYSRNFTDENGEFQLELTVSNIRTVFETELRLPTQPSDNGARKELKMESPYFHFGHYDWHVAVSSSTGVQGRPSVELKRLTGFDHQCRVRYLVVLGESDKRADSGILDQLSDKEGRTPGWTCSRNRIQDLVQKGTLRLYFEMILANTTSEVKLQPVSTHMTSVQCYDRDKQVWTLEPDLHSDMLRFRIAYNAIHNVPRNHLRYVCWNAYLLRRASKGLVDSVCLSNGPFSNYYAQESSDDGIIMESDIPVTEVREGTSDYVDDRKEVTLQIEWVESLLLFQSTYSKYDDVTRMHNFQMRKSHGLFGVEGGGAHGARDNTAPLTLASTPMSSAATPITPNRRPTVSSSGSSKLSVQGGLKGSRSPQPQRPTHLMTPNATGSSLMPMKSLSASASCVSSPQHSPSAATTSAKDKRREIGALEAENYSLERQVFSYQKSMAYAQTRGPSYEGGGSRRGSYVEETRTNYPEEVAVPPANLSHSRRPSYVEDARATYSNENQSHSRRPSYVEDARATSVYPSEAPYPPEEAGRSRSPYQETNPDPGSYFLQPPGKVGAAYQSTGYAPTDFNRPTTPSFQPGCGQYSPNMYANGARREYDAARDFTNPLAKNFDKKTAVEGARGVQNYDYNTNREYNCGEYDPHYSGGGAEYA